MSASGLGATMIAMTRFARMGKPGRTLRQKLEAEGWKVFFRIKVDETAVTRLKEGTADWSSCGGRVTLN